MRLGRKRTGHAVSYGLEVDGDVVYRVRCVNGAPTESREYRSLGSETALAQALKEIQAKAKVAISINGPVDAKEATVRGGATNNPTVLKALVKNAASVEMSDVEYVAARRLTGDSPSPLRDVSSVNVILMGMIGGSEIEALFSRLGEKRCFVAPVQSLSYVDGIHLHLGHRGAALYLVQGGLTRRTSFVDSCRFSDLSQGLFPNGHAGDGESAEEKARQAAEYLRKLTENVSQDLVGWRRNDPAIGSRIIAHGAGAVLSSALVQSFALREIEVEILDHAGEAGLGPEFEIARLTAVEDTSDEIRSFANPVWEKKMLEQIRVRSARARTARIVAMTCGLLALTVVPTVAAAVAKNRTEADITGQRAGLAKYQPILAMYKTVSSEATPIRTAQASAPDWTKVWQVLENTQPPGAAVRNVSISESAAGVMAVEFSAMVASQQPFAPIVAWIKALESRGATGVKTSTMTYSPSSGVQTASFQFQLDVGSATGITAPSKTPAATSAASTKGATVG